MALQLVNNADTGLDARTKINAGISGTGAITPVYVAGRWYAPARSTVQAGTALTANTIRLTPFALSESITIDQLGARVTTAVASSNVQLAIYADIGGAPGGPVLANTANLSSAVVGLVSGAIVQGTVQLPPGKYWMAVVASGAVALQAFATAFSHDSFLVGAPTLATISSSATASGVSYSFAGTFGTWPNLTATPATVAVNTTASGVVFFRVASVP